MKIAFPYMGTVLVYKKLLEFLGHEVIIPPRPSQRTIDLGVKYSPEFACFPFKVITGSYIESCEMGADTIITSGGHGPCRAGFYGEIHKKILSSMGYDIEFIIFDSFFRNKNLFTKNLMKIKGANSWLRFGEFIRLTYDVIKKIDAFEKDICKLRPYETINGQSNRVWENIQEEFERIKNRNDFKKSIERCNKMLNLIEIKNISQENKIKIGIVGEIYVVMESSINMDIERLLGSLGCEVERSQYLSNWVNYNMIPSFFNKSNEKEILKKGEPYIEVIIGGHAKQTIGHIIDFKEKGFDGIIHLMPFGCLPELVSQGIIPKLSKEYDIPILSISIDEQSGRANNTTRIEAFIDVVKNKKLSKFKLA